MQQSYRTNLLRIAPNAWDHTAYGPFLLLQLAIELQVKLFTFCFGGSFDLQNCQDKNYDSDEEDFEESDDVEYRWTEPRSNSCLFWTSPDITTQVRTAYLTAFRGYIDLKALVTDVVLEDIAD